MRRVGALPKTAVGLVVKTGLHRAGQVNGKLQMLRLQCRLVEVKHAIEQKGIRIE